MKSAVAILAAGCFWGVEELLRKVSGVLDTEVGYSGGTTDSPTYETVKTGRTGHAESIEITYDPDKLSYAHLLQLFFQLHDPTTLNRQGNDVGTPVSYTHLGIEERRERMALQKPEEGLLRITARVVNAHLQVSVRDDGRGWVISKGEGRLGLEVLSAWVKRNQGSFQVQSDLGVGSVFEFSLPLNYATQIRKAL